MEYLLQLLGTVFQDESSVRLAFVALVAVAIMVFVGAVALVVAGFSDPLRRRMLELTGRKPKSESATVISKAVQSAAPLVLPKAGWELQRASQQLVHAGYRSGNAIRNFYGIKTILGILFPVAVLVAARNVPQATTFQVGFAALGAAFFGMTLPNMFVRFKAKGRQRLLRNGFPDALDLMVVCVEAGLGLDSAIQRVADEMTINHPELADELVIVNAEIRAGMDRVQALKGLAERTGLEDIRGLVVLLAQSLRFGTSVASTLRVYAVEFRDKRMQRAEELAAMLGTKLIFPLIFCFFPSFFLVAIGPAIIGVLNAFSQQ